MVTNKMKQRMTPQKREVLNYLRSVKTHPSAEKVWEAVLGVMPEITLATVYRILNQLAENGEILKLVIDGEARFDGDVSAHSHCYCRKCGDIIDLMSEKISDYAERKMDLDFDVERVHVVFYGICKNCKEVLDE